MMRAVVTSVIHLVVAPVILAYYGLTPVRHADLLAARATYLERLTSVVVFAVWVAWLWGVWSVVVAVRRRSSIRQEHHVFAAPHIVLALTTVLSALGGEHESDHIHVSDALNSIEQVTDERDQPSQGETAALAVVAGVTLRGLFARQRGVEKGARRGDAYLRHNRMVQLTIQRLFAASRGLEQASHHRVDSTGTLAIVATPTELSLLPLGHGPDGCISLKVDVDTSIHIDNSLDVEGIVRYVESLAPLVVGPSAVDVDSHSAEWTTIRVGCVGNDGGPGRESAEFRLHAVGYDGLARLEPSGVRLSPFSYSSNRKRELATVMQCVRTTESSATSVPFTYEEDQSPDVVVRVIGPLEVMCSNGTQINFRRSKSAELLTWLVLHRDRPSRDIARTAMWENNVQDSTFNNVVSELRRALRDVSPALDFTESRHQRLLVVPGAIRTDIEMMETAWRVARRDDTSHAWARLHETITAIRGLPFESTNFEWADAEGLTSHIMLKVMNICGDLAQYFLDRAEVDKVFHVTELGLRALPGSEEMLDLRERAMAVRTTVGS